jgi:epoxide hydrolase-like predicted phosphatase
MIKAVLFDFGGVLSEAGAAGSIRRIFEDVYGMDMEAMHIEDISQKMWEGKITDDAFLAEIKRRWPDTPDITADEFRTHMEMFTRSEPVYALAGQLRAAGIKTAILSNVFGIGLAPIQQGGFYEGFDPVILSCQVGIAKPEPGIYDLAVRELGLQPNEIIFIDDQQGFLDPAIQKGFHTVLARSPGQIVADTWQIIDAQKSA